MSHGYPHRTYTHFNLSAIENFRQTYPNLTASDEQWPLRSVKEVLIRTFATHVVTWVSYGHLMSLQELPSQNNGGTHMFLAMIGFQLFPTLPIAQTIRRVLPTVLIRKKSASMNSTRFLLAQWLGIVKAPNGLPCRRGDLFPFAKKYDFLWLGRMVVLVLQVIAYCLTLFLWTRRFRRNWTFIMWAQDNRNLEVVLGGLWAVFLSIGISGLNTEWKITGSVLVENVGGDSDEEMELVAANGDFNTSVYAPNLGFIRQRPNITSTDSGTPTSPTSTPAPSRLQRAKYLSSGKRHQTPISKLKRFVTKSYHSFRQFNLHLSNTLLPFYPHDLQWDFELAYVLHLLFYSFFRVDFSYAHWQKPSRMPWAFAGTFFVDRLQDPLLKIWPSCNEPCLNRCIDFGKFIFLLPLFVILTHFACFLLSHVEALKPSESSLKVFRGADFWLRRGRTLISLPASLLMLLPFISQVNLVTADVYWYSFAEEWLNLLPGKADSFSRWQRESLWKDPISDTLYII